MVSKKPIKEAIKKFISNDKTQILKSNSYEPTISHRIAVYLENAYGEEYKVDCEYNKKGLKDKRDSKGNKIRPDIIIHKRGKQKNLVVLEIKKAGKDSKKAKEEIKRLKDDLKNLDYQLGVFIGVLKKRIDVCWIEGNKSKPFCEEFYNENGNSNN